MNFDSTASVSIRDMEYSTFCLGPLIELAVGGDKEQLL
jgi:hypothetical protein